MNYDIIFHSNGNSFITHLDTSTKRTQTEHRTKFQIPPKHDQTLSFESRAQYETQCGSGTPFYTLMA